MFLFIFFLLRKYTGGLHLKSKINCLLFSVFLTLFIPYFAKLLHLIAPIILGGQFVISLLIALFPIIETPQKFVSTQEKKIYKRKSLLILFFVFLLNITLVFFKMIEYSTVILLTLLLSLFSVLLGFIKYN